MTSLVTRTRKLPFYWNIGIKASTFASEGAPRRVKINIIMTIITNIMMITTNLLRICSLPDTLAFHIRNSCLRCSNLLIVMIMSLVIIKIIITMTITKPWHWRWCLRRMATLVPANLTGEPHSAPRPSCGWTLQCKIMRMIRMMDPAGGLRSWRWRWSRSCKMVIRIIMIMIIRRGTLGSETQLLNIFCFCYSPLLH